MKKITKCSLLLPIVILLTLAFPLTASAAPLEDGRTVFGETYTLESGKTLNGDLNVIGGIVDIETDAMVDGNVLILGGVVNIDGTITGDLTVIGGTVTLNENAIIKGDLYYSTGFINKDKGSVIEGDEMEGWSIPWANLNLPEVYRPRIIRTPEIRVLPIMTNIARGTALTLLFVALGALLLLIMPKAANTMTQALVNRPWDILGFGALTALVILVGSVILTITICLIPVAILLGMAFGLAVLAGWLALGYELGKRMESLFKTTWHPVLAGALGNLLLYLIVQGLRLIPCIGGFLVLVAGLFGLGMAVVTLFGTNPYPPSKRKENQAQVILVSGSEEVESNNTTPAKDDQQDKTASTDLEEEPKE